MGARRGSQYLESLKDGRQVWLDGAVVEDVSRHPRLGRAARSLAQLYELQHDPKVREEVLAPSPATQEPVGRWFLAPHEVADLVKRRAAFKRWADFSGGLLGRSPDFLSTLITALSSASSFFGQAGKAYAENLERYHHRCREHDLCLTHALGRAPADQPAPLQVVSENDRGLIVSGSRTLATLAPYADELVIFPGPSLGQVSAQDAARYAVAFAIPVAAPGLRLICRSGLDTGGSTADLPLTARFDEQDAVVIFDNVLVPHERVFLKGDKDLANNMWRETLALSHGIHQFITKNQAKAELVLGVASLCTEATGVDQHPQVQAMMGEIVDTIETLRAYLCAAEACAVDGPGGTKVPEPQLMETARDYFPALYPRLIEVLQLVGASGLIAHVPEATEEALPELVELHYRGPKLKGREKNRLFKLAWDLCCSGFAGRQLLYERFFDGDLFRKRATRYQLYPGKQPARDRVRALLEQETHR
jgi:4-hydroxyphenylacetate 3-monooxygenase